MPRAAFLPQPADFNIFSGEARDGSKPVLPAQSGPRRASVVGNTHSPIWVGSQSKFETTNVMGRDSSALVVDLWDKFEAPKPKTEAEYKPVTVSPPVKRNSQRHKATFNPFTGEMLDGSAPAAEAPPTRPLPGQVHTPLWAGQTTFKTSNVMSSHNPYGNNDAVWETTVKFPSATADVLSGKAGTPSQSTSLSPRPKNNKDQSKPERRRSSLPTPGRASRSSSVVSTADSYGWSVTSSASGRSNDDKKADDRKMLREVHEQTLRFEQRRPSWNPQ